MERLFLNSRGLPYRVSDTGTMQDWIGPRDGGALDACCTTIDCEARRSSGELALSLFLRSASGPAAGASACSGRAPRGPSAVSRWLIRRRPFQQWSANRPAVGDDHRPAVGHVRVDRGRDRARPAARSRGRRTAAVPGELGGDRPVDMAGDHADDVAARPTSTSCSRAIQARPGRSVSQSMPVSIGGWWSAIRVGRSGASSSRAAQPGGARLAEGAAVPPLLERVEHEDAQRPVVDRILDEAVARSARPGNRGEEAARGCHDCPSAARPGRAAPAIASAIARVGHRRRRHCRRCRR